MAILLKRLGFLLGAAAVAGCVGCGVGRAVASLRTEGGMRSVRRTVWIPGDVLMARAQELTGSPRGVPEDPIELSGFIPNLLFRGRDLGKAEIIVSGWAFRLLAVGKDREVHLRLGEHVAMKWDQSTAVGAAMAVDVESGEYTCHLTGPVHTDGVLLARPVSGGG